MFKKLNEISELKKVESGLNHSKDGKALSKPNGFMLDRDVVTRESSDNESKAFRAKVLLNMENLSRNDLIAIASKEIVVRLQNVWRNQTNFSEFDCLKVSEVLNSDGKFNSKKLPLNYVKVDVKELYSKTRSKKSESDKAFEKIRDALEDETIDETKAKMMAEVFGCEKQLEEFLTGSDSE